MKNIIEQGKIIVAIYKRLSDDDDEDGTSISIETQGKIITDYCRTHGFVVYDHYSDDGFTGTNFNRPDFMRMMDDAKAGKFNTIIVKDLSRFGRNYLQVGAYVSETLPQMGIRFIAIGDNVDTAELCVDYDLMFPIKNIFNEYYPADCSRKTKEAFIAKANQGEFIGSHAPYGLKKSTADKHVLEIDEVTCETVVRIFKMAAYQGYGYNKIARVLSAEKIITPSAYQAKIAGRKYDKNPYDWNLNTVYQLVRNEVYLGHFISGKRRKVSFKSKRVVHQSEDKWIVKKNLFPALISEQLWNDAHAALSSRKRETVSGFDNIFAGLLKCDRCGYALGLSNAQAKDAYYMCNTYKKKGKEVCSNHYIKYDELYDAVLNDIRDVIKTVKCDKQFFIDEVTRKMNISSNGDEKRIQREIADIETKITEYDVMFKNLYKDKLSGLLSENRFKLLANDCELEQDALQNRLVELREMSRNKSLKDESVLNFVNLLEKYEDVTVLDRDLLNALVNKIVVGDRIKNEGVVKQTIRIEYRFIGSFEDGAKRFA